MVRHGVEQGSALRRAFAAGSACLALLALALAATHSAPGTDQSPLVPEGSWRPAFVVAVAGAFAAYLVAIAVLARRHTAPLPVVALAIAIQLAPLAAPLLLSKDVYAYWGYGRVSTEHGANPYEVAPGEFPHDPAAVRMGADWVDTTSLYGPAFTALAEADAALAGDDAERATDLFRLVAALAMVAIVLVVAASAARPAFAAAFVGWNPLLALHFAGGGHNDALMMVGVVAALALAARSRHVAAGASLALASAVKWIPLLLLPLWALASRRPRRLLAGFAAAAVTIAALATARYGLYWFDLAEAGAEDATWTSSVSLPFHLAAVGIPVKLAIALTALAFAAVYAALLVQARRGRARLALAAGVLALASSWLVPWYAVWAVALAAVEEDRLARLLALGLSAYLLLDAV